MEFDQGFLGKLKDHLLGRLLGEEYDGGERTYDQSQRSTVTFVNDVMWSHLTMQVNFTTYDLRRETHTLNVKKNRDVMIKSCEDDHPYWYCRIVGIYHVMVRHVGTALKNTQPQRMDFLTSISLQGQPGGTADGRNAGPSNWRSTTWSMRSRSSILPL